MIWLILVAVILIIYILIRITRYNRINHTHTAYSDNPLKNKKKRRYNYHNNRQDINFQSKKPYDALFTNPKNKQK